MSMNYNIVEIDGKHYLELPCLPGTTVYMVGPRFELGDRGLEARLVVHPLTLYFLDDIVRNLDSFKNPSYSNAGYFLTREEAEAEIERLIKEAKQ